MHIATPELVSYAFLQFHLGSGIVHLRAKSLYITLSMAGRGVAFFERFNEREVAVLMNMLAKP